MPPARIDLLRAIPGVRFDEASARRVDVELDGATVHIVSKDLIASKRAAGREKELRDLRALERT